MDILHLSLVISSTSRQWISLDFAQAWAREEEEIKYNVGN